MHSERRSADVCSKLSHRYRHILSSDFAHIHTLTTHVYRQRILYGYTYYEYSSITTGQRRFITIGCGVPLEVDYVWVPYYYVVVVASFSIHAQNS